MLAVVATRPDEIAALNRIEARSIDNQVPGLRRLRAEEIGDIEPHVVGVAALHSPHTAVVDYVAITKAMAQELREQGGSILFNNEVVGIRETGVKLQLRTRQRTLHINRVIVRGGLQSDILAQRAGASPSPRILPFRGEYRSVMPSQPWPGRDICGEPSPRKTPGIRCAGPGPPPSRGAIGLWGRKRSARLCSSRSIFARPGGSSRSWPVGRGRKTTAGVRAQAWDRTRELLDAFAIDQIGSVTLLRNAPSPAATSAMAIAHCVTERHVLGH